MNKNKITSYCIILNLLITGCTTAFKTTDETYCKTHHKTAKDCPKVSKALFPWGGESTDECKGYYNCEEQKNSQANQIRRYYYLPVGRLILKLERQKDEAPLDITLTTKIVPDLEHPLYMIYNPNMIFFQDQYVIETDEFGLLKTVSLNSTAKSVDIINKINEIASTTGSLKKIYKNNKAESISSVSTDKSKSIVKNINKKNNTVKNVAHNISDCDKKFSVEIEIDLNKHKENADKIKVNSLIYKSLGLQNSSNLNCVELIYPLFIESRPYVLADGFINGIAYRNFKSYTLKIREPKDGENNEETKDFTDFTVGLPDIENSQLYPIYRKFISNKEVILTFNKGVLTREEIKSPNFFFDLLTIPAPIINAYMAAFGSIVK